MSVDPTTRGALTSASVGELGWVARDGRPRIEGVVPLVLDGSPAVAFTYADHDLAVEVASSGRVAVAVTEARSTGGGFRPMLCAGRPRLIRDPDGELFADRLLNQELRRYPPSRLLADSPLLRREHWWYLPRMVVTIDVDTVRRLPVRRPFDGGHGDHLLAVATGDHLDVQVVTTAPPPTPGQNAEIAVTPAGEPVPDSGVAALFAQDASFPDLERWSEWSYRGRWDATTSRFTVVEMPTSIGLEPVPSLISRWRRQRDLERRCRKGLAAHARPT